MSGPRTGLPTPSCPRPVGPSWSWAHDCPGLGHGQALPVGELGAPPRGESKRKGSGLDQEPEAGRALDSALADGARGGGEAAERPRGALATRRGPDFGKRSHFPAPLAGRRSRSAGGTRAARCFPMARSTSRPLGCRRGPRSPASSSAGRGSGGGHPEVLPFPWGLFVIGFARAVLELSIKDTLQA